MNATILLTTNKGVRMEKEYLDEREAASYLNRSVVTLQQWRHRKQGPAYYKDGNGRIRYVVADLQAWAESERVES